MFPVRKTLRTGLRGGRASATAGTNPRGGVVFRYYLGQDPGEDALKLVIEDAEGNEIRTHRSDEGSPKLPAEKGGNVFAWNMRHPDAKKFDGMVIWNARLSGPMALPGRYKATLSLGDDTVTSVSFDIAADPRSGSTAAELKAQFDFLIGVRDKLSETHEGIGRLRDLRDAARVLRERIGDREDGAELKKELKRVVTALDEIEKALYQTKNRSRQDPLNYPIRLNDKLAGVMGLAALGDRAPTRGMRELRKALESEIDVQLARLSAIVENDVPRLNERVRALALPALVVEATDDDDGGEAGASDHSRPRSEAQRPSRPRTASGSKSGS